MNRKTHAVQLTASSDQISENKRRSYGDCSRDKYPVSQIQTGSYHCNFYLHFYLSIFQEKKYSWFEIYYLYTFVFAYVFAFAFLFVFVIVMAKRLRPGHMPGLALLSQICILD